MNKQVWPLVVKDMLERNEKGAVKYNRYLQTNCPDNMLQHAYEEALDLCVYLKTQIEKENKTRREALTEEDKEWILKSIKSGQILQQSIQDTVNEALMKLYISPSDYQVSLEKSQEK